MAFDDNPKNAGAIPAKCFFAKQGRVGAGRNKNYYKIDGSEASINEEKNVRIIDSAFYSFFKAK